MPSAVETFRDRLLDRVPVYKPEGRTINCLAWPVVPDAEAGSAFAQVVSRWTLDALAVAVERDDDLAAIALMARRLPPPATAITTRAWHSLVTDLAVVSRAWPEFERLRPLALHARGVFDAVGIGEWTAVAACAADALHAHVPALDALVVEADRTVALLAV